MGSRRGQQKIKSGFIRLGPIHDYIRAHLEVPRGKQEFRGYSETCERILLEVPETQGWYFWGKFNNEKRWKHIYIGMAGYKKLKLHSRIKEELKDERVAFWADVWGRRKAAESHMRNYHGKYQWEMERALEKKGTEYIIWISDESATPKEIRNEESILIQRLDPSANKDRRGNREPTKKTGMIEKFLAKEIKRIKGINR